MNLFILIAFSFAVVYASSTSLKANIIEASSSSELKYSDQIKDAVVSEPPSSLQRCPVSGPLKWRSRPEFVSGRRNLCPKQVREQAILLNASASLDCVDPIPRGYEYPPNWPERATAKVNFRNFGQSRRCTSGIWCNYLNEKYIEEQKQMLTDFLLPHLPLCSGRIRTVLDVGGGGGDFAFFMQDYGALTLTMNGRFHEFRDRAYAPFQEFIAEKGVGLHLTHSATDLPYPFAPRSFDMIFNKSFTAFISTTKWSAMLREWNRIVRPGGLVVFILSKSTAKSSDKELLMEIATNELWWAPIVNNDRLVIFITPTSDTIPKSSRDTFL